MPDRVIPGLIQYEKSYLTNSQQTHRAALRKGLHAPFVELQADIS